MRGVGFAGNLRTLSLVEVFQTLGRIQGTGVLRLAAEAGGRDVVFDEGKIIGIAFREGERKQALLKRLILLNKLDAHSAASLSATGSESQVVQAIIEQGWVSAEDVTEAYEQQAREELESLTSWDYADFVFEDAVPEQEFALQLVERYRKHPITIDMSHLLIESTRRSDEWVRLRDEIPDDQTIFSPVPVTSTVLLRASTEYPATAVVPLIDGVRTVHEICEESVTSRLDTYAVIGDMLTRHLIVALQPDEIMANADHLIGTMDFHRAARLYRLLLSKNSTDTELCERLAACLEHLGDPMEASACLSQLAQSQLELGDAAKAEDSARRAVELAPSRPEAHLGLSRCLLAQEKKPEAVEQLRELVTIYLGLGHLEEARSTCLKILTIAPGDEDARRELARIFSRADREAVGEDVVVCVRCDHVNHREAATCAKCGTSLQLTCLSCQRIVCVSDRLCIFCGANPHAGSKREPAAGRPTTARFLKTDRIASTKRDEQGAWRKEIAGALERARAAEEQGRFADALVAWKEVASFQQDSSDIQFHIRELEIRISQRFIEERIVRGHELRKKRRFYSAMRCYKEALRLLPAEDPRTAPLNEILASCVHWHRRNAMFYGAAIVVVASIGFMMVVMPQLQLHYLRTKSAKDVMEQIEVAKLTGSPQSIIDAGVELAKMSRTAEKIRGNLGREAKLVVSDLSDELRVAQTMAAEHEIHLIAVELGQGQLDEAADHINKFGGAFPALLSDKLLILEKQLFELRHKQDQFAQELSQAPARLAKAQACEKAQSLDQALEAYRTLLNVSDAKIASEAVASVARLEPQDHSIRERCDQALKLVGEDLHAADQAFAGLEAEAGHWHLDGKVREVRADIRRRLDAATADWAGLGANPGQDALVSFIGAHPGSPEIASANARLAVLRQLAQSRTELDNRYKAAVDGMHWQDAWQAARDLVAVGAVQTPIPEAIDTLPEGATVSVAGKVAGTTPCVVRWTDGSAGELVVSLEGWQAQRLSLADAGRNWHLKLELARQEQWRTAVRRALNSLVPVPGGVLASGPEVLALIDPAGHLVWSTAVPKADSDLSDHPRPRHLPVAMPEGASAIAMGDHGIKLLDSTGKTIAELPSDGEIRGRPTVYSNELMGEKPRLAFAASALYAGAIGEDPAVIPLTDAAIAGPLVVARDLERVLCIVDVRGHLLGIEESTKKQCWDLDLSASDCGMMVPLGGSTVAMVLDGSRLVSVYLAGAQPVVRWSHALSAAVVGDLVVAGGNLVLASGDAVLRLSDSGAALPSLALGGPASCQPAVAGDLLAVGRVDGRLLLFQGDRLRWSTLPIAGTLHLARALPGPAGRRARRWHRARLRPVEARVHQLACATQRAGEQRAGPVEDLPRNALPAMRVIQELTCPMPRPS